MTTPILRICTKDKRVLGDTPSAWEKTHPYYDTMVDLLDLHGWLLKDWSPSVPEPKGGGIFRSSPLVDGRKLAYRKMDNVTDTFNLVGSDGDQDGMIHSIRALQSILEKATEYWTSGWQNEPVWIEAKGPLESGTRYAVIVDYRLSGFGSPYQQPFFNCQNSASEAILVIEHGFWQDTVPGEDGKCVELRNETDYFSYKTYDGGTFYPAHSAADVTYSDTEDKCNVSAHVIGVGDGVAGALLPIKTRWEAGIVFENVTIPVDAPIKSATLRLKPTIGSSNISIVVKGQTQVGGAINSVTLVNGGYGYFDPNVVVSGAGGTGSGAVIVATVASGSPVPGHGTIIELTIVNPGSGYVNPTIRIYDTVHMAHGAIATCTATPTNVDAAMFSGTGNDFTERTRTLASVTKEVSGSAWIEIPILYIIREILGYDGWTSGDNIGIFLTYLETPASGMSMTAPFAWFNSFDEGVDYPELIVEWSTTVYPVGRDTTCAQEVFVANKRNYSPVKHIFSYDDSAVSKWSPNMAEWNYSAPMPLFQDNAGASRVPDVNDIIYFGSCGSGGFDTLVGPFSSLVFDIYGVGDAVGIWQYYNGIGGDAGWEEFVVGEGQNTRMCSDNLGFTQRGVTSIVWEQPGSWIMTTINGNLGYWIRFKVTVKGTVNSWQWHRDIYTVLNPYIDIEGDRVPGDVPALAKINFDSAACLPRSMNTLVLGLRSLSRGKDFNAYLNASDKQSPSDPVFACEPYVYGGAPDPILIDTTSAPTGRALDLSAFNPNVHGKTSWTPVCSWIARGEYAKEYMGIYHVFVRCNFSDSDAVGLVKLRAKSLFGDEYNVCYSDINTIPVYNNICVVDLGQLSILPGIVSHPNDNLGNVKIFIECLSDDLDTGYVGAYIYDLILMPADEWSGNFGMPKITGTSVLYYDYGVEVDAITVPKQYRAIEVHKTKTHGLVTEKLVVAEWSRIASSEPMLQSNSNQRLWFFQYKHSSGELSYFEDCGAVCLQRSSRYILMKGN